MGKRIAFPISREKMEKLDSVIREDRRPCDRYILERKKENTNPSWGGGGERMRTWALNLWEESFKITMTKHDPLADWKSKKKKRKEINSFCKTSKQGNQAPFSGREGGREGGKRERNGLSKCFGQNV